MSEQIKTYSLDAIDVLVPMDRDAFYEEQTDIYKKTGAPTKAVEIVNIFLFNRRGELIVQKRAMHKNHNAGLLDKSIGGHVTFGDEPDYTVMVETVQELQVPSIVLRTQEEFEKTYRLLDTYLNTIAVVRSLDRALLNLGKKIGGEKIQIANRVNLYVGVYEGAVKTVDQEARGILFYTLDELEEEMKMMPEQFTDDLKLYLEKYGDQLRAFVKSL